jgi:NAD(P)-dependent dehydrogenase (short-subunit alcohol dehydrogenase family)
VNSSNTDFSNRVAIVTGAATGIGSAIAESFLMRGASVVLADINIALAETTAAKLRRFGNCLATYTDVSDEQSVAAMVQHTQAEMGNPDYLINSAGIILHRTVIETSQDEWNRQLAVQLTGPFLCSREVARNMLQHGTRGSIVNIVSAAARMGRIKGAAHCASKAGLVMLTQVLAMELGQHGIRVNAVGPGLIDTETQRDEAVISSAYKQAYLRELPLGRLGEPSDVAEAVVFLCSNAASWITGHTMYVDGGFLAGNLSLQGLQDIFDETPLSHRS